MQAEVNLGIMTNVDGVPRRNVLDNELDDLTMNNLKYGVKVGTVEDCYVEDVNGYNGDQTVPLSQFGYVLGVPEQEWADLQAGLLGNEDLDIDPHYAFFGCNTDSEVAVL